MRSAQCPDQLAAPTVTPSASIQYTKCIRRRRNAVQANSVNTAILRTQPGSSRRLPKAAFPTAAVSASPPRALPGCAGSAVTKHTVRGPCRDARIRSRRSGTRPARQTGRSCIRLPAFRSPSAAAVSVHPQRQSIRRRNPGPVFCACNKKASSMQNRRGLVSIFYSVPPSVAPSRFGVTSAQPPHELLTAMHSGALLCLHALTAHLLPSFPFRLNCAAVCSCVHTLLTSGSFRSQDPAVSRV